MSAPTVFITVPKYVAISPVATNGSSVTTSINNNCSTTTVLHKIKPAPPQVQIIALNNNNNSNTSTGNCSDSDGSSIAASPPKGKKRRLDHLSWEEKIQRK